MESAGVAELDFTSDDVGGGPFPHARPGMLALSQRAGRMQQVRCVFVCVS